MVRPRGRVVLVGMPGKVSVDLAPLWHRELTLVGAYAYGTESPPGGDRAPPHLRPGHRAGRLGRPRLAGVGRLPPRALRGGHRPRRRRRPPRRGQGGLRSPQETGKEAPDEPQARIRARRRPLHATHPVLAGRAVQPRAAARGEPGHLRAGAGRAAEGPLGGHPGRPHPPGRRPGAAPLPPPSGHEADHRLRRHLAAPAPDGAPGHPPAGHRAGPGHGGRGRRGRRGPHRGPGPPPPHDRAGAPPRHRRPHLRRLRPQRPAHPARRRGPRRPHPPGPHRPGGGRGDQQAGRRERPPGLRQHQPGGHGRRPQERGHRAGQLQEPAPPPQPADHAAVQVVHGPAPLRAALGQLADGPADRRERAQHLPDRDHPQQRHVPDRLPASSRSGSGSGRRRTGSPTWPRRPPSTAPRPGSPVRSSTRSRPPTG